MTSDVVTDQVKTPDIQTLCNGDDIVDDKIDVIGVDTLRPCPGGIATLIRCDRAIAVRRQ